MLSGSYPIFALSNHTTFSQTQTSAIVPLSSTLSILWTFNSRVGRHESMKPVIKLASDVT
jgi:hypothetical protein